MSHIESWRDHIGLYSACGQAVPRNQVACKLDKSVARRGDHSKRYGTIVWATDYGWGEGRRGRSPLAAPATRLGLLIARREGGPGAAGRGETRELQYNPIC